MNGIEIEAIPYDENEVINFVISAKSFSFSGLVEVFTSKNEFREFGKQLLKFPKNIEEIVSFEYGDDSGEWPAHLTLQAAVIDGVGHSAIYVKMRSITGGIGSAQAEFSIPSEPAQINELGRAIINWLEDTSAPISWHPKPA